MLQAEAIFKNDDPGVVTSSIYTVPKQHSDQRRPVINLRFINRFTRATHFKMSSIRDVKAAVHKGDFMAKIDLKDCFWQVPIYKRHQKYLSVKGRDKIYSFKTLPFGLNAALDNNQDLETCGSGTTTQRPSGDPLFTMCSY